MRAQAYRRTAAVVGAALVIGGLAPASVARADGDLRRSLDTHAVPGYVLGVVGTTVVASSDEGGVFLKKQGQDWVRTALDADLQPEDVTFLGGGKLVALAGYQVRVLDAAANSVTSYATDPAEVRAATPDFEVDLLGTTLSDPQPVKTEYAALGSQIPLAWPALAAPSGAASATSDIEQGWLSDAVWIAPTVYADVKSRLLATDLRYLPTDGGAGFAFRVPGAVLYASPVAGQQAVRYVSLESRTLKDCTATAGAAKPTCRSVKTGVSGTPSVRGFGTALGVTVGSANYVWRSNKLTKVTGLPAHTHAAFTGGGVDANPVLSVWGAKLGFYTVASSGKATVLATALVKPVEVGTLALGAGWVVGTDSGGSDRGWARQVKTDGLGATSVLSTKAAEVATSGSRYAVNGGDGLWFYSGGVRTAKLKAVPDLTSLSGPYALIRTSASTWSLRTDTKVVASGLTGVVGQFGSLVAQVDLAAGELTVRDYASGTPKPVGDVQPYDSDQGDLVAAGMWGDDVVLGYERPGDDDGSVIATTVVVDYRTSERWSTRLARPSLGDGVVAGYDADGNAVVWNFRDATTTRIDDTVTAGPVASGNGTVAYATHSDLVVSTLAGAAGGGSAPRVLGSSTSTGTADSFFRAYDGWRIPWRLSVEASKALAVGELRIANRAGDVVATVPVKAAPDGVLTVSWDGTLDNDGGVAETGDGPFTWTLAVSGVDGPGVDDANLLKTLDGRSAFTGTIDVENSAIRFPQAKPKISDTTPMVGQKLTVDAGPTPPGADVVSTWFRGKTPVHTGADYTVAPGDLGQKLTVTVSVDAMYYTDSAPMTSSATGTVGKGSITGGTVTLNPTAPAVGTAVHGTASGWASTPDSVTYQWYRVNAKGKASAISKQTAADYTPTSTDVGYRLRLDVTAHKVAYNNVTVHSALTTPVAVAAG